MHTNLSTRSRKIFFVMMLAGIILILNSLGIDSPVAHAQDGGTQPPRMVDVVTTTVVLDPPPESRYYSVTTVPLSNGALIDEHTINGPSVPPPGFELERQPVGLPMSGDADEPGIGVEDSPDYVFGCSPTAAGNIGVIQDRGEPYPVTGIPSYKGLGSVIQLPNLYTGPTNGGVMPWDNPWTTFNDGFATYANDPMIATKNGLDGRTTQGTIDYYWVKYESPQPDPWIGLGWAPLVPEALADFMKTSQSTYGNIDGSTKFVTYANSARPFTCDTAAAENRPDGTLGRKLFYESKGYAVGACYNQSTDNVVPGGFSLAQYRAEIDAGRPVMIGLQGHNVVGIGYNPASTQIFIRDGWDFNVHSMTWGGSYAGLQMLMVSMANPIPPAHPGDYTISGYVGVPNATITYTGGSTKASISGYYSFSVGPGWSGRVTPSKPGYNFQPAFRDYASTAAYKTKQNYGATPVANSNLLKDPGFELGSPNPQWIETSTNFGTPLCDKNSQYCQGASPRTGSIWGWFGGISADEVATLAQPVTIPQSPAASLDFYFMVGNASAGSNSADVFTVKVDGTTVFSANATQINSYAVYTPVSVDVSAYANGGQHTITFGSATTVQIVSFHLDDVSLAVGVPPVPTYAISGNTGMAGVTLSYTEGTPKTVQSDAGGNYSIVVPAGWSGIVTPSKPGYVFTPSNRSYTNVQQNLSGQNYTPLVTISGTVEVADVTLSYSYGGPKTGISQPNGNYFIRVPYNWTGTVTPTHACFTFTPPSRSYNNLTANQTGQNYTSALKAGTGCADINAWIGATNQGHYGLLPGASTRASYSAANGGPVKLISNNAVPLIASERVIYKVNNAEGTSFSELMGLPDSQLDTTYWLPWYNNVDLDTQLRFANVSSQPATVQLYIGGQEKTSGCTPSNSPYTLAAGASLRVSCAGVNAGPVQVVSTQNIVAAERVIYKVNNINTSFSEMMGLPDGLLDTTYWFPWYNNVDLDTQLRFGVP